MFERKIFKRWNIFICLKNEKRAILMLLSFFMLKKIKRAKQQSDKGKLLPFFAYEIYTEKVRKLQFLF